MERVQLARSYSTWKTCRASHFRGNFKIRIHAYARYSSLILVEKEEIKRFYSLFYIYFCKRYYIYIFSLNAGEDTQYVTE